MKKSVLAAVLVTTMPALAVLLTACGKDQPPSAQETPPVTQAMPPQATMVEPGVAAAPTTVTVGDAPVETYSPEALESLLAPIALYPDPVLAQVLATSTNPQEVLDAGNWLLQNADLTGDDLQAAATSVGFTPAMVALVQFPTVVDMMCVEMDWTTELGSAFLADEPGVLDAVQRLRSQAADMGNLQSSEQMKVATETQNNQQVIIVEPAKPEVVYVPQYDPAAVYTTPAPAPTQVSSTTVATSTSTGYSTGAMVTTGLLAFGAGILVNEIFDDDDNNKYYYPSYGYGYGRPPYYPPPYRPRYGNGYRPAHGYNPPKNYKNSFNNNTININTGNKNYFNQFDSGKNNYRKNPKSPITAARPNRPELNSLNQRSQTAARSAAPRQPENRQVQGNSGYAGAREKVAQRPATTVKTPAGSYAGAKPGARETVAQRPATSVKTPTGSYAGAKRPATTVAKPQTTGARDRGRVEAVNRPTTVSKPAAKPTASRQASPSRPSGLQGAGGSGKSARSASERGRESMSKGAKRPAKGKAGFKKGTKR